MTAANVSSSRKRRLFVESLEPRIVLAGDVVISELMASNTETLLDEDNDTPDWVEIENRTSEVVSLNGWYLTDDRRELTKWQFPDVTLQPRAQLLIYMSDKDRRDPAANLHANFKLSSSGEYLALVRADGRTIEDDIQPGFPPQTSDVSYGRGAPTTQVLLDSSRPARLLVPPDGGLDEVAESGPRWTLPRFDDAGWMTGFAGFGFDVDVTEGTVVTPFTGKVIGPDTTFAGNVSHLINQPSEYLSPVPINASTTHTSVHEADGGWLSTAPATVEFDLVFPSTFDHLLFWNYSFFDPISGRDIQQDLGTKEFAVSFSMDGADYSPELLFTTAAPTMDGSRVPLQQFELGERTARFVRLRQISSHAGGLFGLGEIAFSRGSLIDPDLVYDEDFVATDLTDAMHDTGRSSIYIRAHFDVHDARSVTELTLRMRYDDGFVAYLNGVEVARAQAPAMLDWTSSATAKRADRDAVMFSEFDITGQRGLLQDSGNVLAIHGLNSSDDASDFLLHPEMFARAADPVTFGFLAMPTPGEPNGPRAGAPVTFAQTGGVITEPTSVELSVGNSLDTIRYTLDGSEPDETSPPYSGPIVVSGNTEILARSFTPIGTPGQVGRQALLSFAADVQNFSSNLPVFVIESFGERITAGATLRSTFSVVFDVNEATGRASVSDEPNYQGRSGLRQRGRSSASFPQHQYKYETWDQSGDDMDVSLLGLPAESDWVLNGPYTDKSLMRNVVTYKWWGDLGHYSPRTRFVEVFLNVDGDDQISYSDDYVGVYVLIESVKRGDNRIDIQPPENTSEASEITGGYVIEVGNPGQFSTRVSGRAIGYQYEDPAPGDLNSAQRAWIKDYIEEFETALYSPNFVHPQTGKHYSEYIDVSSFVDYRIMREFTRDFDGGSTYFSIDRGGVMTMGPFWDMNWALGNVDYAEPRSVDRCGCDIEGWNYSYTTPTIEVWPAWAVRLQEDPDHWQLIVDRWHELRQTVLKDEVFLSDIEQNFQLLDAEAAARNFAKWNTLGRHTVISPPGFQQRDTYQKEVEFLEQWLVQHAAWLDEQFVPAPLLSRPGGTVEAGTQLGIASAPAPLGRKLVSQGDMARYAIAANDGLGTTWTEVNFPGVDGWNSGPTGLGFDNSEGYASNTGRDIRADMGNQRSALIRMNFDFDDDPGSVRALRLHMRYDDGFVAYLNGAEVTRSPSVSNATPGSARSTTHEAYDFEVFDISAFKDRLIRGNNVLAIHGINASSASTDFLIIPELVAEFVDEAPTDVPVYYTTNGTDPRLPGGAIHPDALLYEGPITIDDETTINARALLDETWSAIQSEGFLVDVVPAGKDNLRISEIHYNPAAANVLAGELDVDNDEFEFVELVNVGDRTVNLENVRFVEVDVNGNPEGISFVFPRQSLGPGQRVVIAENRAAFVSRYGDQIPVTGQFDGRLANGGERITLLAADGSTIQSFRYAAEPNWPESPQGFGPSLQVIATAGDYNQPDNWRGSGPHGGTPGAAAYGAGDANLDRRFDSSDLVRVFQSGEYEDAIAGNSTWSEGDWNGDQEFDTSDLVFAFQSGSYLAGALVDALMAMLVDE